MAVGNAFTCFSVGHHYSNWCSRRAHQNAESQDLCSCSQQHAVWSEQHQEVEDGVRHQGALGEPADGLGVHVSAVLSFECRLELPLRVGFPLKHADSRTPSCAECFQTTLFV